MKEKRVKLDSFEVEDLARQMFGLSNEAEDDEIENALYAECEISLEQFLRVVERLILFTVPAVAAISGEAFQGFVKDGAFIVRTKYVKQISDVAP